MAVLKRSSDNHVAITMGREAAEHLAEACRWASYRAEDALDGEEMTPERRRSLEEFREWLDWGSRWLVNEEARSDG